MTGLGGVGGGTNPAGEREARWRSAVHEAAAVGARAFVDYEGPLADRLGEAMARGFVILSELADDETAALRAVVEGLRTQLRESHEDYARLLSRWDDEREAHAALRVRVDAVKALAAHREFESSLVLKSEIREALEGLG